MSQVSRMVRKRGRSSPVRVRVPGSRTPSPLTPRQWSPRISPKIMRSGSPIQEWEGEFILTPRLEDVLRRLELDNNRLEAAIERLDADQRQALLRGLNHFSSKRKPKTPMYRDSLDEKRMKKLRTIPEERMSVIQRLTSSSFPTRIKKFFTPKKNRQRTLNIYNPYLS